MIGKQKISTVTWLAIEIHFWSLIVMGATNNLSVNINFLMTNVTDVIDALGWTLTWHVTQNGYVMSILTILLFWLLLVCFDT
jgi:hypothetical protein